MKIVKYAAVGLVALMLGVVIGTSSDTRDGFDAGAEAALATPTVEPTPTSVPTPEPTPVTITETVTVTETVEVEVVPQVCRDALYAADGTITENLTLLTDILSAYVDYPDEDLVQFGRRVEDILMVYDVDESDRLFNDYMSKAEQCHAS